jgi:hypothetical protein
MRRVCLRDIVSPADRAAVMGLHPAPGQDEYSSSMEKIIAEAAEEQRPMPHPWAVWPVPGSPCSSDREPARRVAGLTEGAAIAIAEAASASVPQPVRPPRLARRLPAS